MLLKVTNIDTRQQAIPVSCIKIIGKATLQEMTETGANCFLHTEVGMLAVKDTYADVVAQYERLVVRN